MEKKVNEAEEFVWTTFGCILVGTFIGAPFSYAFYGAGILNVTARMLGGDNKYKKLFKELKLCNESEIYPEHLSKRKTAYGYDLRFSVPTGLSIKQFEQKHEEIEAYFKRRVNLEYDNGKNILMRIYEHELKRKYDFSIIHCDKILEVPYGYTYGDMIVKVDIEESPHVMIAGSTGGGKSVLLNVILANLITKQYGMVEVYIIDFKGNEFVDFEDCDCVKAICSEIPQAEKVLTKLRVEMEERYKLFKDAGVKKLSEYNKKAKVKLPYKVLIIDEYADLMGKEGKYCKEIIQRLSQKARGAGIHMILSTQRDSADVIDGFVKNNIPTVIGLTCGNSTSSRVIIDRNGLENLTKNGHFIMKHNGEEIEGRAMYIDSMDIAEAVKGVPKKKAEVEPKKEVNLKVLDRL